MNEFEAEIFAEGIWHGIPFKRNDIEQIVESFNELKTINKVPFKKANIKIGHNDEQPLTDGQPALGWIESLRIEGKKLFGKFVNVPDIVRQAIEKDLYKKVSIELDVDVHHKQKFHKYVLTGVALLGAELPAVNTLADLTAYFSRDNDFTASKEKYVFSAVDCSLNKQIEDEIMTPDEIAAMQAENAKLKADKQNLEDKNLQFKRDKEDRERQDKQDKIKFARKEVTDVLESAVKDEHITPGQREKFSKLLNVDNDDAVLAINIEDIKALVADSSVSFSKDSNAKEGEGETTEGDAGAALTTKALEIQGKNTNMKFSKALEIAMGANPELAKAHIENTVH